MQSYIHQCYLYILTNAEHNVLSIGVTNDLQRRVYEHKNKLISGFTAKYNCNKLVYFEEYQWVEQAIEREKQLKAGSRKKKIDLIIDQNSQWNDLSAEWYT